MKDIFCDPEDILSTKRALNHSYWPEHPDEIKETLANIESDLIHLLKSDHEGYKNLNPLTIEEIIPLLTPLWMQLVLKLLMASAAIDTAPVKNLKVHYSADLYRFWDDYEHDRELEDQPLFSTLCRGPQKSTLWRWPLRILVSLKQNNNIRRYPLSWFNPQRHIAVTSNLAVVSNFCTSLGLRGFYIEPDSFFSKISDTNLQETKTERELIEDVTRKCLDQIQKKQVIRSNGKIWLQRQISISIIYAQRYIQQALESERRLPRQLVSNLGGIWNGLLRFTVKKAGGTVHVIDHGCGSAIYKSSINSMTNLSGTSVFYAFSPLAARFIKENLTGILKIALGSAQIDSFSHTENYRIRETSVKHARQRVLVIPLSPIFDRGLSAFYPVTSQALDFNARLIAHLQDLGWQVTLKPHPAFMEFGADQFLERYGAPCETRPFEVAFTEYDCIVSCDFSSSTLVSCLYSDKPLVFFDIAPHAMNPDVIQILKGRAEINNFSYSKEGRVEIQWDALANMLEAAMVKIHNNDFIPLFQESPTATSSHG